MAFNKNFIDEVKNKSDLLSVISANIHLKKKGNRYWGCCPFHNEKTPSFSVMPDKGFFYCFGCHKGGDVFKFISLLENISYKDAIKLQAQRNNIKIPYENQSSKEQERENQIKELWQITKLAGDFFHNCLRLTNLGKAGLNYCQNRNIKKDIIHDFHLGFAPNMWDKLYSSFLKKNMPINLLVDCGLIGKTKDNKYYDRFRNRLIIPIMDEYNRVCGFGGRVIDNNDNPKYLNSPETLIFNKRNILFALNKAKEFIKKEDRALVTEGYMDAISLHNKGIKIAVASLGTAFTYEQCRLLLRFTKNIYFCYDNDKAGQAATMRALAIAQNTGANVYVITLKDVKDPDEFLQNNSKEDFLNLFDKAMPLMEFQLNYVLNNTNIETLEGKLQAVNELLPLLLNLKNMLVVNEYLVRIASVLGIDESLIRQELNKKQKDNALYQKDLKVQKKQADLTTNSLQNIIKYLWDNPNLIDDFKREIPFEILPDGPHKEILLYMDKAIKENKALDSHIIIEEINEDTYQELSYILVLESNGYEKAFYDSIKKLKIQILNNKYEEHRLMADKLQRKGDLTFLEELKKSQLIREKLDLLKGNI